MKIIAELCQNHKGDPGLVSEMVSAAAEAGATHVKLQTMLASRLAFRPQFEQRVEVGGVVEAIHRPFAAERARLKRLELDAATVENFIGQAYDCGMVPLTTCFARGDVGAIAEFGFKEVKVASYDCASFPMLRELAERFEQLYVSTGASFDDEIVHAAAVLKQRCRFALLHCVTIYPTPLDQVHLARVGWLRGLAPTVGFSDHTLYARDDLTAAKAAIVAGAEVVERHFTVLPPDETKDGPVSVDPEGLARLVAFTRLTSEEQSASLAADEVDLALLEGDAERTLSHEELLNRDYYRGRFATPRAHGSQRASEMIFNWEETPL